MVQHKYPSVLKEHIAAIKCPLNQGGGGDWSPGTLSISSLSDTSLLTG